MRAILLTAFALCSGVHAADRAKNVILLLADAGGIPTLNAASLHGYGAPQKLYVQSWPHVALSDTSAANAWVTDSAAGMTAIVTGVKTGSGVVSEGPDAVYARQRGTPLKTLLEYAEEKGLSTGVLTNVGIADATPAALYAHSPDRMKWGDIFLQLFAPRFGDGADVVIGAGRRQVYDQAAALGQDLDQVASAKKRSVYETLSAVPAADLRPIVVSAAEPDLPAAAKRAVEILSKNRKGYFLMIEWDAHTDNPRTGLDNVVKFDKLIRELSRKVNLKDTLMLFTADHSFELQTVGGGPGQPLLTGLEEWTTTHPANTRIEIQALRVGRSHTGEEVLAAAQGAGSEQVKGFLPNTQLFHIMMNALGWNPDPPGR
jgi:alkaline phosphatase